MAEALPASVTSVFIDDDESMVGLTLHLLKKRTWFDVRVPATHRWQVAFGVGPAGAIPKKLKLIYPKPTAQKADARPAVKGLAAYRTAKKKEMKGKRR
jgi:hypothetical protein